jgi:hypothetical protein
MDQRSVLHRRDKTIPIRRIVPLFRVICSWGAVRSFWSNLVKKNRIMENAQFLQEFVPGILLEVLERRRERATFVAF